MKQILQWKLVRWGMGIFQFLRPMQIPLHGAYAGFFLVLSVFPMAMVLFAWLGYTTYGAEEVLALAAEVLPEAFLPLASQIVDSACANTSGAMLSVSVLAALWSAGRGIRGVLMGLNAVYGLKENRSYPVTRGISAVYTFLFLIVLILTLVLHVFGTMLVDYLQMTTHPVLMFLTEVVDLRFLLLLALQTALFAAVYAVLPNRKNTLRESLPGAVLASVGWMIFSELFSVYVMYFPNYANIFGSVYAAALAMLWLYFCVCIVFYGAALNRYLMERRKG